MFCGGSSYNSSDLGAACVEDVVPLSLEHESGLMCATSGNADGRRVPGRC
jgi:hypothetical protein